MTTLTILITLTHYVSFPSHLVRKSNSSCSWAILMSRLLWKLNSTKLAWYFLHGVAVLAKASTSMWVCILIGHVVSLVFVVELASIWRWSSLRYKMSSSNEWTLVASRITIFTNIINSLRLSVFSSHWWNIPRRCLRTNPTILLMTNLVIILNNFRFVVFTNDVLLLVIVLLLLRYLETFSCICTNLFGSRCSSYRSANAIAFFFTWSLTLIALFFDNKLVLARSVFLLLNFNLHLILALELVAVVKTFQLLLWLIGS